MKVCYRFLLKQKYIQERISAILGITYKLQSEYNLNSLYIIGLINYRKTVAFIYRIYFYKSVIHIKGANDSN